MNNIAYVYCLEKDGIPFYVGRTISIENRKKYHKTRFNNFEFKILFTTSKDLSVIIEKQVIRDLIDKGIKLENRQLYPLIKKKHYRHINNGY